MFIEPMVMDQASQAHIDSVVEDLKLADRHEDKRYLRHLDSRLAAEDIQFEMAPRCGNVVNYCQWQLALKLGLDDFNLLLDSVSVKKWVDDRLPMIASPSAAKGLRCSSGYATLSASDHHLLPFHTYRLRRGVQCDVGGLHPRYITYAMPHWRGCIIRPARHGLEFQSKKRLERYVGFARLTRDSGSSNLRRVDKEITEAEQPGTMAVDWIFGR